MSAGAVTGTSATFSFTTSMTLTLTRISGVTPSGTGPVRTGSSGGPTGGTGFSGSGLDPGPVPVPVSWVIGWVVCWFVTVTVAVAVRDTPVESVTVRVPA